MRGWLNLLIALTVLTLAIATLEQNVFIVYLMDSFASGVALVTNAFLSRIEPGIIREGVFLYHPGGFSYAIDYSCTGIIPIMYLSVAILFFPTDRQHKRNGFLAAVPYVLLINEIRLVSLFIVGVVFPGLFPLIHEFVWELLMVVFVGGFWIVWINQCQLIDGESRRYRNGGLAQF